MRPGASGHRPATAKPGRVKVVALNDGQLLLDSKGHQLLVVLHPCVHAVAVQASPTSYKAAVDFEQI